MQYTVGIIGAGIAGSTAAIKLSQCGIRSVLFEKSNSLVNGPPMCHLHAGGALYREISTEECVKLLKQSISTLKCYPHSENIRPTLLAVPLRDKGEPETIVQRLQILTGQYQKLIDQDETNQVLGKPCQYFKVFTREDVERLKNMELPQHPKTVEQWLVAPAKYLQLSKFKFPFVMVQQYGLSSLRVSAYANSLLEQTQQCKILKNTSVAKIEKVGKNRWGIYFMHGNNLHQEYLQVDYILNAAGYRSGQIDNMVGFKVKRLVEFKAAYITSWPECKGRWPEVIMHGKRKTPEGMAQLTPYPNNYFQIHGMTENITLFKNGLVNSSDTNNQPQFDENIKSILQQGWKQQEVIDRTRRAIEHVSFFLPSFRSAIQTKKPLYGAQQIPGQNPELRASEISFQDRNYARAQIVKASTAIDVAQKLISKLQAINGVKYVEKPVLTLSQKDIIKKAKLIALERNYPPELAQPYY